MLVDMQLDQALYVCRNMQPIDRREREALHFKFDTDRHAIECYQSDIKYCVLAADGEPIVIGGINFQSPGVGRTWMCGTDRFPEVIKEVTKATRRMFSALLENGEVHRIETLSAGFHDAAHRWFRLLKLEQESVVKGLGKNGEDYILFRRLR